MISVSIPPPDKGGEGRRYSHDPRLALSNPLSNVIAQRVPVVERTFKQVRPGKLIVEVVPLNELVTAVPALTPNVSVEAARKFVDVTDVAVKYVMVFGATAVPVAVIVPIASVCPVAVIAPRIETVEPNVIADVVEYAVPISP